MALTYIIGYDREVLKCILLYTQPDVIFDNEFNIEFRMPLNDHYYLCIEISDHGRYCQVNLKSYSE